MAMEPTVLLGRQLQSNAPQVPSALVSRRTQTSTLLVLGVAEVCTPPKKLDKAYALTVLRATCVSATQLQTNLQALPMIKATFAQLATTVRAEAIKKPLVR